MGNNNVSEHFNAICNAMMESTSELVFFKDLDLKYRLVSNSFVELLGFDSSDNMIDKGTEELFNKNNVFNRFVARDKLVLEGINHVESYFELVPKTDGRQAYLAVTKRLIYDENDTPIGILGIGIDKTKEYEAKLSFNIEVQSLFGMSSDGLMAFIFDLTSWRILESNYRNDIQRFCYNLSEINDFKKLALETLIEHPDVNRLFEGFTPENLLRLYNDGRREFNLEYMVKGFSGSTKWIRFTSRTMLDPLSEHLIMVVKVFDIDAQMSINGNLLKAAEQDSMTGLLNHDYTFKYITNYLNTDGIDNTSVLLMIDVDNFKSVNDNYGHQTGDEVLIRVAQTIKNAFRSDDIKGRVGGDEFMVLMKNCGSKVAIDQKVPELIKSLNFSYSNGISTATISCSIGVSIYEGDSKSFDQLYYEADAALYRAKAAGKNSFAFEEPTIA